MIAATMSSDTVFAKHIEQSRRFIKSARQIALDVASPDEADPYSAVFLCKNACILVNKAAIAELMRALQATDRPPNVHIRINHATEQLKAIARDNRMPDYEHLIEDDLRPDAEKARCVAEAAVQYAETIVSHVTAVIDAFHTAANAPVAHDCG